MVFKKLYNLYSNLIKDDNNRTLNFTLHIFNFKIFLKQNARVIKAKFKL